jgi:adenosylcobinamide-phosphate guanylyltransferase
MNVTALLMAGGRGSRLRDMGEKPLIKVCGKPMIQYVLEALEGATKVEDIIVAVSRYAPKTAAFVQGRALKALQTPGRGFCLDAKYAIKKLNLKTVLTICADLPLITSEFIDKVITSYEECKKPALTVMVPRELYTKYGLSVNYVFNIKGKSLIPIGVNVVDGRKVVRKNLDEEILIIDDIKVAVNVNTLDDIRIAEQILHARSGVYNPPQYMFSQ